MATRIQDFDHNLDDDGVPFKPEGGYTEDEKHRMTLRGLADARAGRTISNERVMAWLDSLDTDTPLPMPEPWGFAGRRLP